MLEVNACLRWLVRGSWLHRRYCKAKRM